MKKFDNFVSHIDVLAKAKDEDLENEFIISGIIDKFSIQFELSWKVLKELLKYEGRSVANTGSPTNTGSPREILKASYAVYDFIEEDIWLSMLKSRNDMTHIYDGEAAKQLVNTILNSYIPAFLKMKDGILEYYQDVLDEI